MSTEAMKLALRSLKELVPDDSDHAPAIQGQRKRQENALKALQEALAQPQQEPVAWIWKYANGEEEVVFVPPRHVDATHIDAPSTITPLYTSPPARKPLTDEEIEKVWRSVQANDFHDCVKPFARAIEAAHGIKGDA